MKDNPKWKKLQEEFQKYLDVIVKDHHKTKDGILRVSFSYDGWSNEEYGWVLEHPGYNYDFCITGDTLDAVLDTAIKEIQERTKQEIEWKKESGIVKE